MWWITILIFISLLLPSTTVPRIDFHLTDSPCENEHSLRHHCLYVPSTSIEENHPRQIISYCLTECPYKWNMNRTQEQSSITFQQLAQRQITSQQLYLWSAPIDLVEKYQFYLNQLVHSNNNKVIENGVFYRCIWPRFGSFCEYSFDHLFLSQDSPSSLIELVHEYYLIYNDDIPTALSCYDHLKCHRGPSPSCLDWTEICDGKIDCLDSGQDEEHCWQLEVNECEKNEYRCTNGQCVPQTFLADGTDVYECLDGTDEPGQIHNSISECNNREPTFSCEDVVCPYYQSFIASTTGSMCKRGNQNTLTEIFFTARPNDVSDECWFALLCRIEFLSSTSVSCKQYCQNGRCHKVIEENCLKPFYFLPSVPLLFGHLYFVSTKDYLVNPREKSSPEFICLDDQFCNMIPIDNTSRRFNNMTCHHSRTPQYILSPSLPGAWTEKFLAPAYYKYWSCASLSNNYYDFCGNYHVYHCINSSKCISRHRLLDKVKDCFYGDDEQMDFVSKFVHLEDNPDFFKCSSSNKYISRRLVGDKTCDCGEMSQDRCDDEYSEIRYSGTHISFQTICDGFTELRPMLIDGQLMTDETHCDAWVCNNIYTRCDKIWNCMDGSDEMNCHRSLPLNCSSDNRLCVLPETNELICISLDKINDGYVDCLGGTDEPKLCRINEFYDKREQFYCRNSTSRPCIDIFRLCTTRKTCAYGDDQQFCRKTDTGAIIPFRCTSQEILQFSPIEKHFCERFTESNKRRIVQFSLVDQSTYAIQQDKTIKMKSSSGSSQSIFHSYQSHCHRGLNLRVWLDNETVLSNKTTIACLCPSSFYGDQCQYQNQRISLTLQFRALSDSWQTSFRIIILLIDDTYQRTIHSTQQLTYLPFKDCQIKFNLYLFYSTRPKNDSLNYSIHIDLYEQHTHTYRSSWLIPIIYSFLPVYRVALQLDIPRIAEKKDYLCSDMKCLHGQCIRYTHVYHSKERKSFCQCHQGWSGQYCTIPISCSCSSDSKCLGTLVNHRSICLCPSTKFGPRCLIENTICQETSLYRPCLNGGICIPNDEYEQRSRSYTCVCRKGFSGHRCEQKQIQLIISFDQHLNLPQSVLIHFIRYHHKQRHENATTFKSIPVYQDSITIFWSQPFHLVFLEFFHHQYYLAITRSIFNQSEMIIEKLIQSSDRCSHIKDLFNSTILAYQPLQRIKYYHLLCQPSLMLSCFYDDTHLCLCHLSATTSNQRQKQYAANCFEFDHDRKFDCLGQNGCENGAQCFQDNPTCPQTSMCICSDCFYGRRCQFTMDGFRLSLDAILGYHIRPHLSLRHQSSLVLMTFILTIIMTIIGLINGLFALITFKNKKLRQVGCGYFLLSSSITTLLTMMLFMMKFLILLIAQMELITNRSFLHIQCVLLDYLLRLCLNMDQLLNACVSLERAITISKGVKFNKSESKTRAKRVIFILFVLLIVSTTYDPIYRQLIDDNNNNHEEDRIWCIVSYPGWLRIYDSTVHMVHFCIPFIINIISALIIIWQSARYRSHTRTNVPFKEMLVEQLGQHKYILIAPLVIVVLSLPRLVLSIVSGCMKSGDQASIYLVGYLISFIPPLSTFIIFVVPSEAYREEFRKSIRPYLQILRTLCVDGCRFMGIKNRLLSSAFSDH